jgi:tetratricopeptide (TPR) repeat protein
MTAIEQALQLHQAGQLDLAAAAYLQILAAAPEDFDALQLLGALRTDQGDPAAAVPLLERALVLREDAAVRLNLGRARRALGQIPAAEAEFRRAAASAPNLPQAHLFLANLLRETGRLEPALESYRHVVALAPDHAETRLLLGQTFQLLGRLEPALASYRAGLALAPNHIPGRLLLADALAAAGQLDLAIEAYRRTLAQAPGLAPAHSNLGAALRRLGGLSEALGCFDRAVAAAPGFAEAWYNRGITLRDLGRDSEAEASFRRTLDLMPTHALAETDLALVLLRRGAWDEGWRRYEARWRVPGFPGRIDPAAEPQWRGETPLAGQRLRISAEQGLGDTIQFCRYAASSAAQGAAVELAVPASLVPLLAGQWPGVTAVDEAAPLLPADLHCPLLSLPLALGGPEIEGSAYLRADPARSAAWRRRLGAGPKIGIVWAGNPAHSNDRNRSIALADLAAVPGLDCYAVQKQKSAADRALLASRGIPDLGDELGDFAETAALFAALDLVITVDTAPAHLAGALGRPVWILLPAIADWRWGVDRAETPWYASARLFRQTGQGWGSVLEEVAAALAGLSF